MGPTTPSTLANGLQALSCLRCARQKVRCDRLNPCSRCEKSDASCEFPIPKTERRKRKNTIKTPPSTSNDKLYARLELYEEKLKSLGIDAESISSSTLHQRHTPPFDVFSLSSIPVPGHGLAGNIADGEPPAYASKCPFAEGTSLEKEAHEHDVNVASMQIDPAIDTDRLKVHDGTAGYGRPVTPSALALGIIPGTSHPIDNLYPPQQHFTKLWQIYLQNVHPLTMVLHPASTGAMLAGAARGPGHASNGVEVLLFAVMTAAVMSMTDKECVDTFSMKQSTLESRYRSGCELALVRVEFLMSCNFTVLQAYTVYLSAVSASLDPRELWSLTGIAKRNSQRLGLHQEERVKGLSPFNLEIRRRVWHQIVMQDAMSAQATSLQWPDLHVIYNLKPPTNLNDSDLSPTMKEPPQPRVGATDMIFCNLRYKLIAYMGRNDEWCRRWLALGADQGAAAEQSCRSDRQNMIESMEKEIELQILRYCDILNPLHVLTASVARLALCKQRFTLLKVSEHAVESSSSQATEDSEDMFSMAIRVLEYENNMLSQPTIRGFLWYMRQEFQWPCLSHVLQCLKARPSGERADKAWEQIGRLYEVQPTCYQGGKQKLALYRHAAMRTLTLEAWRAREIYASQMAQFLLTPTYITTLRAEEELFQVPESQKSSLEPTHQTESDSTFPINFGQDMVNWSDWLGLDPAYGNGSNVSFFNSAPDFCPETRATTQIFDNNTGLFGNPHHPSGWTESHGHDERITMGRILQ
ncbi:hypothetical protein PENCOP_c015G01756 [Penicillium coprophilum]|uniref:Zn(2)-C6 fungal-type domain-containing protein n=1 Tax=Penicillium coprophilum TaxID=36646 RepID=A0A1V6U9U1_9EURO|nr:hypothetical protein PENCOP_c015G01756 [Penicillium coprophilum]